MSILAHADHPEFFFIGLLAGAALAVVYLAYRKVKNSNRN
jgi:hypothetical protein